MARNDLPPPGAANFQQRLRETVMTYLGRQGDKLDRGLTLRDLVDANIIKLRNGFGGGSAAGVVPIDPGDALYIEDLTPPPAPTGFTASASTVNVLFETDAPKFRVGNGHQKTVIYGVAYTTGDPLPTFSSALKVTEFPGNVFAHPLDPGSKWRYWATWVTNDGVEGLPAGGTNGIEATTDLIDDAKIANLSASKIKAGQISVGEYVESASYVPNTSGWRINGDGTAFLENAVVRGTVWANNGQFKGTLLGGSATTYDSGIGLFSGWVSGTSDANYRWRVGTPSGARIQWNGSAVEIYNAANVLTLSSGGISASQVTGLGALATQNSVTLGQVTGLGWMATQNYVNWETDLVNIPAFGGFAYLSSITSSNISTYIAGAAIGEAYIANAAITNAKIGNAAITAAKIQDAEIGTLKIAGGAVTSMSQASGSSGSLSFGSDASVVSLPLSMAAGSSGVALILTCNAIGAGGATLGFKFLKDGWQQLSYPAVSVLDAQTSSFVATAFDPSPSAWSTYSVNFLNQGPGTGVISYSAVTLMATGGKR